MDWRAYQSRLNQLTHQRNGYLVLAAGLLGLSLVLAGVVYSQIGRERLIVVPPSVDKPFHINGTTVDASYLEQLSLYWAQLRLSVDAASAPYQHATLLRHVAPALYPTLKNQLARERHTLQKQHLSTVFYPRSVTAKPQALTATVQGELTQLVGQKRQHQRAATYQIHYQRQGDRYLITRFKEVSS
jgi:conjugal transfer pilus assembly protein TraE